MQHISGYWILCDEHNIKLNDDGTCPQCRDGAGRTFVLDMQSTYLFPKSDDQSEYPEIEAAQYHGN
jgi:hypothetical protein